MTKLIQDAIDRAVAADPKGAKLFADVVNAFEKPEAPHRCPVCLAPVTERGICDACDLAAKADIIDGIAQQLKEDNDAAEIAKARAEGRYDEDEPDQFNR